MLQSFKISGNTPMTYASLPDIKVNRRNTNVDAHCTLFIDVMVQENGAPQHILHVYKQILLPA
jgi:hypothetical protein